MPEPLSREAFLRQVADAVDLQPNGVGEVLEELDSHLSDAAAGWREAGLEPDDAERRAIRGLGDPDVLGRELGQARHQRRQLLAAVGGGLWSAFTFGIFAFVAPWLIVGGLALVAVLGTVAVAHAIGWPNGSWLAGPAGSMGTVAVTALWFGWTGWVLPRRVARAANRSVAGVERAAGVAGLVLGSLLLWTRIDVDMDPVLAIGLPLTPLAFLLAALRPARGPRVLPHTSLGLRAGIAMAVVLATTALAWLTFTPSSGSGFGFNVATMGVDSSSVPFFATADVNASTFASGQRVATAQVWVDEAHRAAFVSRYPRLALEVWPIMGEGDTRTAGPQPIASVSVDASAGLDAGLSLAMPTPRTPVWTVTTVVALGADGSRVMLGAPDIGETPAWHGTLLDWWFTGR